MECWNNHSLSTEGNLTPNQQFIRGAIEQNICPSQPQLLHSSQSLGNTDVMNQCYLKSRFQYPEYDFNPAMIYKLYLVNKLTCFNIVIILQLICMI